MTRKKIIEIHDMLQPDVSGSAIVSQPLAPTKPSASDERNIGTPRLIFNPGREKHIAGSSGGSLLVAGYGRHALRYADRREATRTSRSNGRRRA